MLFRSIQISATVPEDKGKGQEDEEQGCSQHGCSVRMSRAQYRLDPNSHVINSVPSVVFFVPLSPACPLGSLFKEHQGEGMEEEAGSPLGSFFPP